MAARSDGLAARVLIRESEGRPFEGGAHRTVRLPDAGQVLKIALGDRPRLSSLVPTLLLQSGARSAIACLAEGAYWLNNRSLAAYLRRVPDAGRVTTLLRRAGLSDRFHGGFVVSRREFESHVPVLASQPFCGGPDVYFASVPGPLLITACHELDLHLESSDHALVSRLAERAEASGLEVRGMDPAGESVPG